MSHTLVILRRRDWPEDPSGRSPEEADEAPPEAGAVLRPMPLGIHPAGGEGGGGGGGDGGAGIFSR